jgi:hypothetical protein
MRRSHVNDSKLLQERTAKMRASSEELKDNHSAGVIRRLAEVSDRHADRAGSRRRRSATKRCVAVTPGSLKDLSGALMPNDPLSVMGIRERGYLCGSIELV